MIPLCLASYCTPPALPQTDIFTGNVEFQHGEIISINGYSLGMVPLSGQPYLLTQFSRQPCLLSLGCTLKLLLRMPHGAHRTPNRTTQESPNHPNPLKSPDPAPQKNHPYLLGFGPSRVILSHQNSAAAGWHISRQLTLKQPALKFFPGQLRAPIWR